MEKTERLSGQAMRGRSWAVGSVVKSGPGSRRWPVDGFPLSPDMRNPSLISTPRVCPMLAESALMQSQSFLFSVRMDAVSDEPAGLRIGRPRSCRHVSAGSTGAIVPTIRKDGAGLARRAAIFRVLKTVSCGFSHGHHARHAGRGRQGPVHPFFRNCLRVCSGPIPGRHRFCIKKGSSDALARHRPPWPPWPPPPLRRQ